MKSPLIDQTTQAAGWTNQIKDFFGSIHEKVLASKNVLIEVAFYGGVGFLFGFILRKFSAYLAFLILCSVALILLHQFDFISISVNWDKIYSAIGFQVTQVEGASFALLAWEWVKANLLITLSVFFGFLIGLHFG